MGWWQTWELMGSTSMCSRHCYLFWTHGTSVISQNHPTHRSVITGPIPAPKRLSPRQSPWSEIEPIRASYIILHHLTSSYIILPMETTWKQWTWGSQSKLHIPNEGYGWRFLDPWSRPIAPATQHLADPALHLGMSSKKGRLEVFGGQFWASWVWVTHLPGNSAGIWIIIIITIIIIIMSNIVIS